MITYNSAVMRLVRRIQVRGVDWTQVMVVHTNAKGVATRGIEVLGSTLPLSLLFNRRQKACSGAETSALIRSFTFSLGPLMPGVGL